MSMITAWTVKQASLETTHVFRVLTDVPTTATVDWVNLEMVEIAGEQEEVEVPKQLIFSLANSGPDLYSFTGYITADKYTVTLNTEPTAIEFEGQYSEVGQDDIGFRWDWNSDVINCYLPPHDSTRTLVELYNLDGEKYDVLGGPYYSRKFWSVNDRGVTTTPGVQRQYYRTRITYNYLRIPGSAWQDWTTMNKLYVRITGVKPILSNVLLSQLLVTDSAYDSSNYGAMVER